MYLVAVAAALLLQAPPMGTDTVEAFTRTGDVVRPAGIRIQTLTRVRNHFVLSSTFLSARGVATYDTIAFSAGDLKPRWHRVHAPTDSAAVVYDGNRVYGYSQMAGAPRRSIDRALPDDVVVGDARLIEAADWSRGPQTRRSYDMWKDSVVSVTYRPLRQDTILHHGRPAHAWVVQEDRGPHDTLRGQPFLRLLWIDVDRRRLLRRQDRPASAAPHDGYHMTARLVRPAGPGILP